MSSQHQSEIVDLSAYITDASNPQAVGKGWEAQIIAFDTTTPEGNPTRRVLRIYNQPERAAQAAREHSAMMMLDVLGYPVPVVYRQGAQPTPYIEMDFVAGDLLVQQDLSEMAAQLAYLMVRLHQLDAFAMIKVLHAEYPHNARAWLYAWIAQFFKEHLPLRDWLHAHLKTITEMDYAILHGDLHPDNILITPDGKPMVLDWSAVNVGDPRFDLGWTMMLEELYVGADHSQQLQRDYEALAGHPMPDMDYFLTLNRAIRLLDLHNTLAGTAGGLTSADAIGEFRAEFAGYRQMYQRVVASVGFELPEIAALLNS